MGIEHGKKSYAPRARGTKKSHPGQKRSGERKKANKLAAEQRMLARARRLGVTIAELRAMEIQEGDKPSEVFVSCRRSPNIFF